MKKPTCHQTYKNGHEERLARPLPRGLYKLNELEGTVVACLRELKNIRLVANRRALPSVLMCCVMEDKDDWVHELPLKLAYWLGRDLLPGVLALVNDGADAPAVATMSERLEAICPELINELEWIRNDKLTRIKSEHSYRKSGAAQLEEFLSEVLAITRTCIQLATKPAHKHSLAGTRADFATGIG